MVLSNWTMSYRDYKALPCTAPASLYGVLLQHELIEDPFFGLNEQKLLDLARWGCVFETEFTLDDDALSHEFAELEFLGLDTICKITLNGITLDEVKNMHRRYVYDVKPLINVGKNHLKLDFSSPILYFEEMNNKHFIYTNVDSLKGAAHLRKALYMSGWDWGPTIPDIGIFRPVNLDMYDGDKIENIFVRQHHESGRVTLDIELETKHGKDYDAYVTVDGQRIKLRDKKGSLVIENPKLWWARGYGQQNLYELTASIEENGRLICEKTQNLGLRTLTVSTKPDPTGSEFCFVLNGVKIFSMGANYIPQDNILSRISPERTEALIKTAVDANFNTLRVWGGGYYPEDEFYDLCDKYGLMVWQDYMVACANIWLTEDMKNEFTEEAIYNIKRLRHHPSLAIISGNNEMEAGILGWGISNSLLVKLDYLNLYEHILPDIFTKYAPDTFYWPSSPSSGGGFDDPSCETRGDVHYWAVWHGGIPFTDYRNHKFRFCSEYGFEAFPSYKTIKEICESEEDLNCFSRVVENHQKCKSGNTKILTYLAENYLYPSSFETLVYASQLLQADAIRYGVEHFRRLRGYCMGSLYWQFNDCWPVASWSSIDSNLRYKALHYAAKKFYAPVALGLFLEDDRLTVNISNETMEDFEGEIRIYRKDAGFSDIFSISEKCSVKSLSSNDVYSLSVDIDKKYDEYIAVDLYDNNGNLISRQTQLFTAPKHFEWRRPSIGLAFRDTEDGVEISVSSNVFAKGVYIDFEDKDVVLSDNFFDITHEEPYTVTVKSPYTAKELKDSVNVLTVYDIGH